MDPVALINPNSVDAINKIMMRYELIRSLGNVAERKLTGDSEMDDLNKQLLKYQVMEKGRELGESFPGEDHSKRNRALGVSAGLGAGRQLRVMDIAHQKSRLHPTSKLATIGAELSDNLHGMDEFARHGATVKTFESTLKDVLLSYPEESHGHATDLLKSLKRFVPHG